MSTQRLVRRAVVLGLLIAVGALAVDMYIPGFAAIARDLHTDPGRVQFSMTAYFLSVAVGQIFYGPLSDAAGRRRPLFLGLAVFAAASVWAAFAPTIGSLIAARFCQGMGAAATAVIPLAVISDEHSGPDAARLMSLALLSLSVSPILAPTLGGLLVQFASWRLIFAVLAVTGLLAVAMAARLLPETLPPARRVPIGPARMVTTYAALIMDRRFIVPLMIAGFGQSVLLVFISGSPFVFVSLHGLKPATYGVVFAFHAMALIGTSQFNAAIMRRVGVRRLLGWACTVMAVAALVLAASVLAGMAALWPFVALTLVIFTCLGLIMPPAFLAAVELFSDVAGAAAAIGVALELCVSSSATAMLAAASDGSARPMAVLMALGAGGSLAAWGVFVGRQEEGWVDRAGPPRPPVIT
jgi:DHA1 family bicyclomycin/chloramphenicol resistance-like MFS transporter